MFENLETRRLLSASVANGILTVTGSDHADRIQVVQRGSAIIVHEGKSLTRFGKKDHIQQIIVNALGGNDRVTILSKLAATVDGGDGKDLIIGGAGNDVLVGGNGNDRILGQRGNDSIAGGAGKDALFAGAGDDTIDAYDTEADQVAGGAGNDSARVDSQTDTAWNIENYLTAQTNASGNVTVEGNSTLNLNAVSGFTVGTYRLFTMSNFTDPNQILIGANNELVPGQGALTGNATVTFSNAVLGGSTERGGTIAIDSGGGLVKSGAGTLVLNGPTGFVEGSQGSTILIRGPIDGSRLTLANLIRPLPQPAETDPVVIAAAEETVVDESPADPSETIDAAASEAVAEEVGITEPVVELV